MLEYVEGHCLLPKLSFLEVRGPLDYISARHFDWLHLLVPPSLTGLSICLGTVRLYYAADVSPSIKFLVSILSEFPHLGALALFEDCQDLIIYCVPSTFLGGCRFNFIDSI